jgi:SMC interacting uncharacterized protein involved in chromosome segregation
MSSRATLGPISTSQANSRMSMGPARLVTHKLSMAPPSVSRHSMMPRRKTSVGAGGGKSGRASSIGHRKSSVYPKSGSVRDTRPVSDKPVMQASVRKIITYLVEHGFDGSISPKTLMSPSNKDFVHVLEFLMQQIDASFTVKGKLEEVILPLFQFMKYPFQLHKRILLCVGSPLTWPHLLAALSWLVDLVSVCLFQPKHTFPCSHIPSHVPIFHPMFPYPVPCSHIPSHVPIFHPIFPYSIGCSHISHVVCLTFSFHFRFSLRDLDPRECVREKRGR